MKRQKTYYLGNMQELSYCDTPMFQFDASEYELPFSIKPTEGAHNYESCNDCKKLRIKLIKIINEKTQVFPLCCERHKKLIHFPHYQKSNYEGLEEQIADKIIFSHHHIINYIDTRDWYENITEYIQYAMESFGSFPAEFGCGFMLTYYVEVLSQLTIKIEDKLTSDKVSINELKIRINKISAFIDNQLQPVGSKSKSNTDFNLLLSTYDKWYKTFPFDLSYFKPQKEKFQHNLPLFTNEFITNRYSGETFRKANTKENLIRILVDITRQLVTSINGLYLLNKGELNDTDSIAIELILKNRELQLSEMASQDNTERKQYIKILKKWFKEEQAFITAIKPLLPQVKKPTHNQKYTRTHIAYCIHYLAQTKSLKLKNVFPSDKAWTEIGLQYNKSAKNIQKMYNEINSSIDVRTSKTRIKIIEYVIKEMLVDFPKAQNLADDELKIALLKS